ncbi:MAG: TRL-like family protein [bacterium]
MMRLTLLWPCLLIGFLILAAGCTTTRGPVYGIIYSNVKTGTSVGEDRQAPTKTGKSCAGGMLGFAWGDASVKAAMAAGGISSVSFVDHTYYNVFRIYGEYCTIVHGT